MMRRIMVSLMMATALLAMAKGKYGIEMPAPLKAGDVVAILSPGSTPPDSTVLKAMEVLRGWGLKPVKGKYVNTRYHGWAGTAAQRTEDLMWALRSKEVKAIICSRGGYGAAQILYNVPIDTLKKYNKWLVGYSDITALHSGLVRSGHMSIHGSMCARLAKTGGNDVFSQRLRRLLFGEAMPDVEAPAHAFNHQGKAKGILLGGNLSVFTGVSGSKDYDLLDRDFVKGKDVVLFLEDVGESVNRVASMLFQMKLKGTLDHVKGIIVGRFTEVTGLSGYNSMDEMLHEFLDQYQIPICYDFPTSHDEAWNSPLIEGCQVELNVAKDKVTLKFKK
ncbi:MAG: LD-carboxypeptidase [Bacteroidales bacterium]|nr:LD-carboxypeptidase [Bacteroidales bacterium]